MEHPPATAPLAAAAVSSASPPKRAAEELLHQLHQQGVERADLAFITAAAPQGLGMRLIASKLTKTLGLRHVIGSTAKGGRGEIDRKSRRGPAYAVLVARHPRLFPDPALPL